MVGLTVTPSRPISAALRSAGRRVSRTNSHRVCVRPAELSLRIAAGQPLYLQSLRCVAWLAGRMIMSGKRLNPLLDGSFDVYEWSRYAVGDGQQ